MGWWDGLWNTHGPAVEKQIKGAVTSLKKAKLSMPGRPEAAGERGCGTASLGATAAAARACHRLSTLCTAPAPAPPTCSGRQGGLFEPHDRDRARVAQRRLEAAAAAGAAGAWKAAGCAALCCAPCTVQIAAGSTFNHC